MNYTQLNFKKVGQLFTFVGMLGGLISTTNHVTAQEVVKSSPAGTGIYEGAINEGDGYLYITSVGGKNNPGGALYKIDLGDLSIVDSILLKENPPFGLAINSKTQVAYTSNTRTNSVSAVDLKTGKVISTFNDGTEKSHTRELLVDEENNLVYVTNVGDPSDIWVIDGTTNKLSHVIPDLGKTSTGMTFVNGKDKLYVTVMGENAIAVVDTKSRKVEKTFPSGGESPVNIVSDGVLLFVSNQKSGTVTVLDRDGKLIKSIETGAGAIGIAYDPVKRRIYSANRGTGTTTVIDAQTYMVLADLSTGSAPNHVKVDKAGVAYVLNKTKAQRRQPQQAGEQNVPQTAPTPDINGDTVTKIK